MIIATFTSLVQHVASYLPIYNVIHATLFFKEPPKPSDQKNADGQTDGPKPRQIVSTYRDPHGPVQVEW